MASATPLSDDTAAFSHQRRSLGKSDLSVSPLAWGMWRLKGDDVRAAQARVETALEVGINLFDTADVYGLDNGESFGAAEALLGQVFRAAPAVRSKMVLATKGGIELGVPYNSSAAYLVAACEASLRRLNAEQVDLYQIHRPDLLAHPAEIAEAFDRLRRAGKARYFGVSNFAPAQVETLSAFVAAPLVSVQPEFSPLAIEPLTDGVLDQAIRKDLAVLAWSPLGGGRLAAPKTPREAAVAAALQRIADRENVSLAAAVYAWVMTHPAKPIAIMGTQQLGRIRDGASALRMQMSRTDWYAVLTASRQSPLP